MHLGVGCHVVQPLREVVPATYHLSVGYNDTADRYLALVVGKLRLVQRE